MKKIFSFLMPIGIVLGMFLCGFKDSEKDLEKYLYGKWKATELAAQATIGSTLWFEEAYLGRSVIIEPTRMTSSFRAWPGYEDWESVEYLFWQKSDTLSPYRYFYTDSSAGEFLEENIEDAAIMQFYRDKDYPSETYVICQDGRVVLSLGEGWYLAERYKDAKTNLRIEDVYGKWRVKRLVAYEESWNGNREMFELNESFIKTCYPELADWKTRDDIDFYPKDYYDDIVIIESDKMKLMSDGQALEIKQMQDYQSTLVERIYYERVQGIHDELGITNEEIQVITGSSENKREKQILDNEIVVINESEIIIKIAQGWFLLEKDE